MLLRHHGVRNLLLKKISDVASVAGKALALATNVAALVNVEHNYYDKRVITDTAFVGGTPQFICLNAMGQGDAQSNRQGNSIKILSEYLKVNLKFALSSGSSNNMKVVRVMLIRMNDYTTSTPTIDMILKDGTTGVAQTLSPYNVDRTPGFTVLFDKVYVANGDSDNEGTQMKYFTDKSWHATYNGGDADDISDLARGSLWLCICGDGDCNYNYWSRLHFVDN